MENLLLLHGAIGSSAQMQPLKQMLGNDFNIFLLDFSGHGGKPYSTQDFSIASFATDVIDLLNEQNISQANIFGYSMGGYVAMYLAKYYPERIGKVITLATKFHWDESTAEKEVQMLDPEKIEAKLPAFAATLGVRHEPNDWKEVLYRTENMLKSLGTDNTLKIDDYKEIVHRCLILLGDRDKMITLEETMKVYKALPNGQMSMLANTPHPIEQVNLELLVFLIRQFLTSQHITLVRRP